MLVISCFYNGFEDCLGYYSLFKMHECNPRRSSSVKPNDAFSFFLGWVFWVGFFFTNPGECDEVSLKEFHLLLFTNYLRWVLTLVQSVKHLLPIHLSTTWTCIQKSILLLFFFLHSGVFLFVVCGFICFENQRWQFL